MAIEPNFGILSQLPTSQNKVSTAPAASGNSSNSGILNSLVQLYSQGKTPTVTPQQAQGALSNMDLPSSNSPYQGVLGNVNSMNVSQLNNPSSASNNMTPIDSSSLPDDAHPDLNKTLQSLSQVESGGNYSAMSKPSKNGDQAYGRYQIMGDNIPDWTKQALGKSMTPDEFLNDPKAQDATAAYQVNKHLQSGNSPQDVASIWFSGRTQAKAGNSSDVYGTTVPQYVNRFNQYYNAS